MAAAYKDLIQLSFYKALIALRVLACFKSYNLPKRNSSGLSIICG